MPRQLKVVFLCVLSIVVGVVNADCDYNSVCINSRDIIRYSDYTFNEGNNEVDSVLWWKIVPTSRDGTILLAFKNFASLNNEFVNVLIKKVDQTIETHSFTGNLGMFELIESNVLSVMINVTQSSNTTSFEIQYYGDCNRASSNLITHHAVNSINQTCIVIVPTVRGLRNRIYLTLRNVRLAQDMKIKVQDIHTNEVLANVEEDQYYMVLPIEFTIISGGRNELFIMIDLQCSAEYCDFLNNQFLISYYEMDETDISCIDVQRHCLNYDEYSASAFPLSWCSSTCPDLAAMMEQEYTFEITPLLLQTDNTSDVETFEQTEYKKRNCPLHPNLCRCTQASYEKDREYCWPTTKCLRLKNEGCTWRCILIKVYICAKIRKLEVRLI